MFRNTKIHPAGIPLVFPSVFANMGNVKSKSPTPKNKPQGNYIDTFVKRMFGQVVVFMDFLMHYADQNFVSQIDLKRIRLAPTNYIGQKGDERIVDLVFRCPLKHGDGSLMAVVIFEHQNTSLTAIPEKLIRYISAIWDAERKEGKKVLSAPYFIVLRTGKKPYRRPNPTLADMLPKDNDGKPLGHVPEIRYDVVDLPAWDFDELIGGAVLRSTLMMLHRITGGRLDDFPEALRPLLEISDEKQRIVVSKELIDFAAKAFAAHDRQLDEATLHEALHPILKGKEKTMIKTIFEEREDIGRAEGRAEGEARGKAEGRVEGKTEAGRNMVMAVLRARFKRVPKEIEKAILSVSDPIALESWAAQAATCQSLNEFAEALR